MKDITTFRGEKIIPAITCPDEEEVWVDTAVNKKFIITLVNENSIDFEYEGGYEATLVRDKFIEMINTYEFRYLGSLRKDLVGRGSLK